MSKKITQRAASIKAKSAAAKAAATARASALKEAPVAGRAHGALGGFMTFVREQGVVGLAVGLVLGVQVKAVVDQLIASFINPLIGLFLPGEGNLDAKTFALSLFGKQAVFAWGAFVATLISFMTVAAVVYFVVKGLRLDKIDKKKD